MGGKRPRRVLTLRNLPCTPPPSLLLLLLFHPPPSSSSPLRRAENAVAPFPAVTFSQPIAVCCADSERKEPKRKGSLFYISLFPPQPPPLSPPSRHSERSIPTAASRSERRTRRRRGAAGSRCSPLTQRASPPDSTGRGPSRTGYGARFTSRWGQFFFLIHLAEPVNTLSRRHLNRLRGLLALSVL